MAGANIQDTQADYNAAGAEKAALAPGVKAYQPPKVTAAPKVSAPDGSPGFWQRIQADGVELAKAVGSFAKNTAVSSAKAVVGTGEDVTNTIGNAEVKAGKALGIKAKTGTETNQQQFGKKLGSFGGANTLKQFAGNVAQVVALTVPGAGKAVEATGSYLLDQLGKQGVKELADKAGIDASKDTIENIADQVAKTKVGVTATKALASGGKGVATKALTASTEGAATVGTFSAGSAASSNESGKQIVKAGEEGAEIGFAAGAGGTVLKAGLDKVTGKTASANDIRAKATTHQAAEKTANEKGLPTGKTTKAIPAGEKTVKQLGSGGTKATGDNFTMSKEANPAALAKAKQINALQDRITKFQQGKLKITPEEAKADSAQLKLLKSNKEITTTPEDQLKAVPQKKSSEPKIVNSANDSVKKSGLNEAGGIKPGQAGADIKQMIDKHNESTAFSKNLEKSADMVEGKKGVIRDDAAKIIKNRTQLTNAEKSELQNYRDAKAAGLTPKPLSSTKLVKEDADTTELNRAAQAADATRARLEGNESKAQAIEAKDPSIYTHRVAQGKGSSYDYVAQGDRKSVTSRGLTKSKSGDKARVLYNLTDENGERHTVSIKNAAIKKGGATVKRINKQVTEFKNEGKTVRSIGSLNLKTNEERMQKELTPVEKNIDNLTKEQKILSATKSRSEAASARLSNIEEKLSQAQDDKATILHKYDSNELDGKTWKAPDGHTYTFSQSTVDENVKNAGQQYYIDPKLNAVANYVDSKTALENSKFVEQIKTSEKVSDFISKPGETAPPGFKSVPSLPQFQGYKFEPKTAEVLKDIAGSGENEANILNATGRVLRQTIVYFPVKHNFNMLASYIVDRGLSKLASPPAYKRMIGSLYDAVQDVTDKSDFYQQVQKKGFQLVSSDSSDLDKAFSTEIKSLIDNKSVLADVAKQVSSTPERLADTYSKIQHVMVWQVQDILNLARIRERMSDTTFSKGESLDDAIEHTAKYNLQYKVPARAAGSRQLANVLKSDKVFFGTYRYDLYRTFTNILKASVNVKDPKGAMEAWDKLAATAVGISLVAPLVNKEFAKITSDPNAHMSAPGILNVPADAAELFSGKESPGAFANSQVYLSGAYTIPYQVITNNNGLNEPIYNPYASTKAQLGQIGKFLVGQLSPAQKANSVSSFSNNKVTTWVKNMSLSLSGVSLPKDSPDLNKYYSLAYEQASPTYDSFRSQVQAGNTKGAIQTADQYNNQLVTSLQKAWEDNNPGKSISAQEVSKYIQGLYNSPWIKTTSHELQTAAKPTKSILQKIR